MTFNQILEALRGRLSNRERWADHLVVKPSRTREPNGELTCGCLMQHMWDIAGVVWPKSFDDVHVAMTNYVAQKGYTHIGEFNDRGGYTMVMTMLDDLMVGRES